MFKISKEILKEYSTPQVFRRGKEYFEDEMVQKIIWDGKAYKAFVAGSDDYEIDIIMDMNNGIDFFCDCPYDWGGICKHAVAAGLAIINNPDDIIVESETAGNPIEVKLVPSELIEQATQEQKDNFLHKILNNNPNLLQQFEVFVKGELQIESKTDIDEICIVLKQKLENLNFSETNLLNNVPDFDGYYCEEWEVFEQAAFEIINKKIFNEKTMFNSLLNNGLFLDGLKIVLAMYEAINSFDDNNIRDDYEFLDSLDDNLYEIWKELITKVENYLDNEEISPEVVQATINLLAERMSQKKIIYQLGSFKSLLLSLIDPETADLIKDKILSKFKLFEIAELLLKIYEVKEDDKNWLKLAEKYYNKQEAIAFAYMDYLIARKMKSDFIQKAKTIFEIWPSEFVDLIYRYLSYEDDKDLYFQVLKFLALQQDDIKYFQEFSEIAGEEDVETLLNEIKENYDYIYYVKILNQLERYREIRDFFDAHIDSWRFDVIIEPIINRYPQHCFDKLRIYAENDLKQNVGRTHYSHLAKKLKWLNKIEDETVKTQVQEWFKQLLIKYKKRPAMRDEFQKVGIE